MLATRRWLYRPNHAASRRTSHLPVDDARRTASPDTVEQMQARVAQGRQSMIRLIALVTDARNRATKPAHYGRSGRIRVRALAHLQLAYFAGLSRATLLRLGHPAPRPVGDNHDVASTSTRPTSRSPADGDDYMPINESDAARAATAIDIGEAGTTLASPSKQIGSLIDQSDCASYRSPGSAAGNTRPPAIAALSADHLPLFASEAHILPVSMWWCCSWGPRSCWW